jgi:hypothetical protein
MKKVFGFTAVSGLVLVAVAVFAVAPVFAMGSVSAAAPAKLPGPSEVSKDDISTTHYQVFDARASQLSNSATTTGQATLPKVVSPAASGSNNSASTSSDHQFDNSKNNGVYPLGKQGLNP